MNHLFAAMVETLHPKFEALISMPALVRGKFPKDMPKAGVYLFSDKGTPLYVGRSDNIRRRYGQHCRPSSQHNQAVFAFKIARHKTGYIEAAYARGDRSRVGLSKDISFVNEFILAKTNVGGMEFRCVEETNSTKQALLEIYCAVALQCPYNDFNNH